MRDALVICTRHRPDDLRLCLETIAALTVRPDTVLIVDSSDDDRTRLIADEFGHAYIHTDPGLTRQRNIAVRTLPEQTEIVHFVDDDTLITPSYIEAIRREFADEAVGGVGGVMSNAPEPRPSLSARFFLLDSRRPGAVLSSGRNILATGIAEACDVQWLSGCAMSFRRRVLATEPFDEELGGYCMGEDVEYSLRVGRRWRLRVTPAAVLEHRTSPVNRMSPVRYSAAEMVARYRRVRRYGRRIDIAWFWWSAVGDLVIGAGGAVLRLQRSRLPRAAGVAMGCYYVLRGDHRLVTG